MTRTGVLRSRLARLARRRPARSADAGPAEPGSSEAGSPSQVPKPGTRVWSDAERALHRAGSVAAEEPMLAIEILSEANRRQRDPRLELRLLEYRTRAFAQRSWPDTPPPLPDAGRDEFDGTIIPEIDAAELSVERVRAAIEHHGAVIVRGLLGPAHVDRLVADVDGVLAAYDRQAESGRPIDGAPDFVPFRHWPSGEKKVIERVFRRAAGGVLAVDAPGALFDLIETFDAIGIGALVREYLGEEPAILARKWTLRRVPCDGDHGDWHQDGAFMGRNIRSLNVWVALSECGVDAPGIDIVGRRLDDIVPTGTHGARMSWTVSPTVVDEVAQGTIARPGFSPGDVLLFDHLNLHRTAVDPGMVRDRHAIEAWFLAPSTYAAMTSNDDELPESQLPIVYASTAT